MKMIMNDFFSLKRFGLLFKRDIQENWKKYLIYILVLFGVLVLAFLWFTYSYNNYTSYRMDDNQGAIRYYYRSLVSNSIILFFVFSCLSAAMIMEPMNRKNKSITYLMQPSSSFEKYLSRWLILTIGYIFIFALVFFPADVVRVLIGRIIYPDLDIPFFMTMYNNPGLNVGDTSGNDGFITFIYLVGCYSFFQSFFVFGAVFWKKNSAVKTFVSGLVIIAAYLFICSRVISFSFDDGLAGFGNMIEMLNTINVQIIYGIIGVVFLCLAIINWILAFFRFKESEIINRF